MTIPHSTAPATPDRRNAARRIWRSLCRAKWPLVALVILALIVFAAVFGPMLATHDPNRQDIIARLKPPMSSAHRGKLFFLLGTDGLGRDVLARLLFGARVSLIVASISVLVGGVIGTILGTISGYFGGWLDDVLMRIADIQLAFPFILLAIIFMLVLGPGMANLILVLGIGQWVTYARIARGQTMMQREREYIEAAKAIGQKTPGILFTGILPNILSPLIIIGSFNIASVILAEAALSFLGLGVPTTTPTWGGMLAESRDQLLAGRWWLALFPGIAIMLTVLSFNLLGDWLRDFLDPRLANEG
ncbi:ABC transporter permease [Granulicella cerasi]|uniref:ABC transporter permease n=1 Tax=Granulicella cerasi TaxID=741063 RepID=A0ABW1ZDI6_9BACT|nr:ABC transporter permease [Granulicella cerasi]